MFMYVRDMSLRYAGKNWGLVPPYVLFVWSGDGFASILSRFCDTGYLRKRGEACYATR